MCWVRFVKFWATCRIRASSTEGRSLVPHASLDGSGCPSQLLRTHFGNLQWVTSNSKWKSGLLHGLMHPMQNLDSIIRDSQSKVCKCMMKIEELQTPVKLHYCRITPYRCLVTFGEQNESTTSVASTPTLHMLWGMTKKQATGGTRLLVRLMRLPLLQRPLICNRIVAA